MISILGLHYFRGAGGGGGGGRRGELIASTLRPASILLTNIPRLSTNCVFALPFLLPSFVPPIIPERRPSDGPLPPHRTDQERHGVQAHYQGLVSGAHYDTVQ